MADAMVASQGVAGFASSCPPIASQRETRICPKKWLVVMMRSSGAWFLSRV